MYYIYEISVNTLWRYADRDEFLKRIHHIPISSIGHNVNDTSAISKGYWHTVNTTRSYWIEYPAREGVCYILYEDKRVLDKFKMKLEAEAYYAKLQKYWEKRRAERFVKAKFTYRVDPVPFTSRGWRHTGYYRKIHKGRREYAIMAETSYIKSRGLSEKKDLVTSWGDDHYKVVQKCWKAQGKRSKQWEKNR